ncbi:MAG: N-acetylmuramoyl-L-alanine amidase [Bacteroidota bacterium]|nr:N-acetylmuramoyl-L-alanine amidase [Bacteroidota bacterium]
MVQSQFKERVGLRDRGVMQAGFLVLYRITMPGVLVETGYLTNSKDEKYLKSEKGQVYIASAIYRAFKEYKKEMEKDLPEVIVPEHRPVKESETTAAAEDQQRQNSARESETGKIYFRVQFATSAELLRNYQSQFKGLNNVDYYEHNGLIKYTNGNFPSYRDANEHKNSIREIGYKDAFVIAVRDNQRIPLKEARKEQP